jgi:hypothetical protein
MGPLNPWCVIVPDKNGKLTRVVGHVERKKSLLGLEKSAVVKSGRLL